MRVEILSLSLQPEARLAQDSSVARLFVEYSLLDLPAEETPLSLPKPPQGKNISYNYSKGEAAAWRPSSWEPAARITAALFPVVPVDAENNGSRRRLLRAVLEGSNPEMER